MREVKFRAWDRTSGIMRDDIASIEYNSNGKIVQINVVSGVDILFPDKEAVLMQYTGLLDKNGVEIYEGDYVKTTYYTNKVEHFGLVDWVDYGFGIRRRATETSDKLQVYGAAPLPDSSRIEVIGNIYEHGHLLENESKE